jgi:hypothetical protein
VSADGRAVPLIGVRGVGLVTLIDESDYPGVSALRWSLSPQGYAVALVDGRRTPLHRFLMGRNDPFEVDHINRHKLDNRRSNLRWVTRAGNIANSGPRKDCASGIKGVRCYSGASGGTWWRAQIRRDGKAMFLGSFSTPEAAAAAFADAHRDIHGAKP